MKTKLIILLVLVSILAGCDDFLLPADENNRKLKKFIPMRLSPKGFDERIRAFA